MRAAAEVLIVSAVAPLATGAAEAWLTQPSSTRRTCSEPLEERVVMACYLYLYALSDRLSDHSDSDHSGSECEAVARATTSDGRGAECAFPRLQPCLVNY